MLHGWQSFWLPERKPKGLPSAPLEEIKHDDLIQAQRDDPTMKEVIRLKESNAKLTEGIWKSLQGLACKLLREWDRLHIENGISY